MDSRLITMKEIEDVFTEPYNRRCAPDHYWEEKKIAFFMLLNCSEIENEKDKMLHDIESQVRHDDYDAKCLCLDNNLQLTITIIILEYIILLDCSETLAI